MIANEPAAALSAMLVLLAGIILGGTLAGALDARLTAYGVDGITSRRHELKLSVIFAAMTATTFYAVGFMNVWVIMAIGAALFGLYVLPAGFRIAFIVAPSAVMFTAAARLAPYILLGSGWLVSPGLALFAVACGAFSGNLMLRAFQGLDAEPGDASQLLHENKHVRSELTEGLLRLWAKALPAARLILVSGAILSGIAYIILATQLPEYTGFSSIILIAAVVPSLLGAVGAGAYWTLAFCSRGPDYFLIALIAITDKVADVVRAVVQPGLILARFPEAICDACLLYSKPLSSSYTEGRRYCEKCESEISFHGGAGKLVVVVGGTSDHNQRRLFIRQTQSLLSAGRAVDLTHIVVPKKLPSSKEIESLATFLINNPPAHSVKSVKVFTEDGWGAVRPHLRNLLENKFTISDENPLQETES